MSRPRKYDVLEQGVIARSFSVKFAKEYFTSLAEWFEDKGILPVKYDRNKNSFTWTSGTLNGQIADIAYVESPNTRIVPQNANGELYEYSPSPSRSLWVGKKPPIFFLNTNKALRCEGIFVRDIGNSECRTLFQPDSMFPLGTRGHQYICIRWPGYEPWKNLFVEQKYIQALSLQQLAFRMKQLLKEFIADYQDDEEEGSNSDWDIRKKGITTDNILLVGLVHVLDHHKNPSIWMPILKLVDLP